jgi:type IV pilus assembly protein PilM
MTDDEKPTSIWKKEISLRKKPAEANAALPVESQPELDAAIAALSVEPEAPAREPVSALPAEPAFEHRWLTKPLEEISQPPLEPVAPLVAPVAALVPIAAAPQSFPTPEAQLPELGLDVEPELAEPAAKVPFYKKELSLKRGPKAQQPAKPKREKKAKQEQLEPEDGGTTKVPFYKRDLSFKRGPKEWDAGEGLTEEAPKSSLKFGPSALPSLPSLSRGGGRQLVGLKIGGSQIAAARVRNGESLELLQAARVPLEHGIVVNGELRDPEALAVALKAFFARHKLPKRGVRLGIANNRIGVRTFEVTGIEDPKQLANAIRFRAQEVLPIPLEEAVLDYQVLGEGVSEDGKPLSRVLLVVAYRELVDRYVYACRKAGLQIVGIDLEAFALLRAVAPPHDSVTGAERGALVAVSVGHDRSTFAVSDGRICEFTRVLEWGGWALNIAIARALDMSPSEVEPIKRALSFTEVVQVPEGFAEEQLATAREASRRQLQTFARELVSSLQFYQNQPGSLGIAEIALTGGTAHVPGIDAELERLIGVPVRVVDPLHRVTVSKKVQERDQVGSLAVAIGLGIED